MEFLKNFKQYILNESEGFGNNYFQEVKSDKSQAYYFKISDESDTERGFIIKMGKFSKGSIITEAESNYSVMSIEEIACEDMEDFLVNKAPYKSRGEEMIELSMEELAYISEILERILDNYLEKSPKVTKIYDEFLENLDMDREEYTNFAINTMKVWSKGRWSAQQGASDRCVLYTKLTHN